LLHSSMRRAQATRHYPRPSLALASDDLGLLKEGSETNEDVLRRQLLDMDRENDKLRDQIQNLQNQLALRPSVEQFQAYDAERKDLELILAGSQRENERCMAELERAKTRIQLLERELARLAGENWQSALDISPTVPFNTRNSIMHHHRSSTLSSITSSIIGGMGQPQTDDDRLPGGQHRPGGHPAAQSREATLAHIESIRLLVLGIEQRLQTREDKLVKTVEKAENEGKKFETLQQELVSNVDRKQAS
ncbi:hypothetical protein AMATHDRAFT_150576, partial [Amanita thiersii Skay4041]